MTGGNEESAEDRPVAHHLNALARCLFTNDVENKTEARKKANVL